MNDIHASGLTMTTSEWRLALAQLCQASALAECGEEDVLLRQGHALLASLPDQRSTLADHLPPMARFEALLAAGAYDSAALADARSGSYMLSRGGEGGAMASVLLPGMEEEMTSEAESPALALMSALAAALASAGLTVAIWAAGRRWAHRRCGERTGEVEEWQRPQGSVLHWICLKGWPRSAEDLATGARRVCQDAGWRGAFMRQPVPA
jgi:hypothetical protein